VGWTRRPRRAVRDRSGEHARWRYAPHVHASVGARRAGHAVLQAAS
jgi:hypothetical protein